MKKVVSIVLCVLMIASIAVPFTVNAAVQTINYVHISNAGLPKDGRVCGSDTFTNPKITTNPAGGATIDTILWYNETDKVWLEDDEAFEGGKTYTVHYYVSAGGNFEFRTDENGAINFKPSITTNTGTHDFVVGPYKGENNDYTKYMQLAYTFPAVDAVTSIKVNLDLPVEGETPDYTVAWQGLVTPYLGFDLDSEDGTIKNGIIWCDVTEGKILKSTDVFVTGHTYNVQVVFQANDGYFFEVDSEGNQTITDITFNAVDGEVFSGTGGISADPTKYIIVGAVMPIHVHTPGFWATIQEAKCGKAGTQARFCTVCNKQVDTKEIPALVHDWSEWEVRTAPSCQSEGEEIRVCSHDSTHRESRVLEKIDHIYDEGVVLKAATDEEEGVMLYTCTMCDTTKEEVIQKLPKNDISLCTIEGIENVAYTGVDATPELIIKNGETVLKQYSDYTVEFSGDTINVGTVTATITGKGSYTGTVTKTFEILPAAVSPEVTISDTGSYTYNGKVKHPSVIVEANINGESVTIANENYDVTYSDGCIDVGDYYVTITLKGNYSGTGSADFEIVKANNTMTVKPVAKTVKLAKVTKAKQTVKKAITVKKSVGKVTCAKVAKGSSKYLKISKNGIITVAKNKNYKKNQTLKINVKVTAKGNKNYKFLSKTVTVKVKVK